jgi:hypothetical protein
MSYFNLLLLRSYLATSTPIRTTNHLEKLVTGFGLTLALTVTATGIPNSLHRVHSAEVPSALLTANLAPATSATNPAVSPATNPSATSLSAAADATVPTVHLFGQAEAPGQVGSVYAVFTVEDQQVVGAFYMPHSSFDCFQGEVQDDRLALTVTNSYDQTTHPYSIALDAASPVAANESAEENTTASFNLMGFHAIDQISQLDEQILSTCQAK